MLINLCSSSVAATPRQMSPLTKVALRSVRKRRAGLELVALQPPTAAARRLHERAMASSRSSASLKSREGTRGIVLTVHASGQALIQLWHLILTGVTHARFW